MATYKVNDLLNQICEIIDDGYEYVDIIELEADEYSPTGLSFEALDEYSSIGYDGVESCEMPEDYDSDAPRTVCSDDFCKYISFTYAEIATLKHAIDNALEYFKECSKDPSLSRDALSEIKASSVDCRNLQAKLAKFFKKFKIS